MNRKFLEIQSAMARRPNEVEVKRCSGQCCEVFFLPWKPDALQANQDRIEDGTKVAAMVVPLAETIKELPRRLRRMLPAMYHSDPAKIIEKGYFYTCKHLDPETKLCRDYENRPTMCRDFPYGSECTYCGCTRKTKPLLI